MTHDNARDALEYAALLLEQQDGGGTLPGTLRQIADSHDGLLAACEAASEEIQRLRLLFLPQYENKVGEPDNEVAEQLCIAIAAARGKKGT